ncbi:unnamed protein product [Hermetia illucens]|uniref:Uncharacterized protein n=1 Tax=Hermetia illucens TaxID=343691 RepID=A0A7R8UYE6_HERIL|nr:unnamed protein product [Hermetia illucens]
MLPSQPSQKSTLSSRNAVKAPPPEKRFSLRKKSKTSLEVGSRVVSRQKTSISPSTPARTQNQTPRIVPSRTQSPRPSSASTVSPARHTPRTVSSTPTTPKPLRSPKHPSVSTIGNVSHLNHRVGELPSYLKKNEKTVTEATLNTKKRAFNSQKKKLTDLQTDFLTNYKALQDLQSKYNKCAGKNDKIEEVKLIALVDGEAGELLIRDGEKTLQVVGSAKRRRSPSPMKGSTLTVDIEQIRPKLLLIHEAGFKLCQEFVDNFDKIQSENTDVPEVGDGTTLQKQILLILKSMEEKIVNEENEQKKLLTEVILELQTAISKKHSDGGDSEIIPTEDQLRALKEKDLEISNLKKQLEDHKLKLEISDSKLKDIAVMESSTIKALKVQLAEKESLITEKEREIMRIQDNLKRTEDHYRKEEKKSLAISNDLLAKESILHKLEIDLEELRKRNKGYETIIDEVKRQKEGILDVIRKEQESRKLYDKECEIRRKLESDLADKENIIMKLRELSKKSMADKETTVLGGGDRTTYETKLYNEVQTLKATIERLNKEKVSLEKEKEDMSKTLLTYGRDDMKLELAKAGDEINHLNTTNACLRDNVSRLENAIAKKVAIINELERKIANGQYLVNASKELQNEINNLRESECEKKREIDALKSELAKAHVEIKQQEETICMNQRLLRIRSELINSLQEKEASNRCRMDDLYSEISKKTSLVNQMNHEISAKAEELQNLFSTLGTKQLEVNRQEHIIKMLEENNERNQRLRVKQEDRIARLENENAELKHLLCKYDAGLDEELQSSTSEKSTRPASARYSPKASKEEENVSTRDLYDFERRKKRRTEIEVKKIRK